MRLQMKPRPCKQCLSLITFLAAIAFSHVAKLKGKYFWMWLSEQGLVQVRPGSNAVLHMSRTQFNQLGSCEVRRLTQLSSTGFIWSGWGVLHAWPAVKNAWRPTLGQTPIFTWAEPNAHQRSNGAILTLPWKPLTNKTAFVFCLV